MIDTTQVVFLKNINNNIIDPDSHEVISDDESPYVSKRVKKHHHDEPK